jgi:hypothetical protein
MNLIVVGQPTDDLAVEVVRLAGVRGYAAALLDAYEAAHLFSIYVEAGRAVVEPDIPLLLRLPSSPVVRTSFDAEFQSGECLATIWTAAVLCRAPVINRPSGSGFVGLLSFSNALTEMRAGTDSGAFEVFAREMLPPPSDRQDQQWVVQDTGTYRTAIWPAAPEGYGPYRHRYTDADPAYEVVVVLGNRAWRCTTISPKDLLLEEKSITLMGRLHLTFGAIVWSISRDLTAARLVRIDPYPSMDLLQFVWSELGSALLEALCP